MPSYKELLELIRDGRSTREIFASFSPMWPSRMRRLLASKRLRKALELEESLAATVVGHRTATGVAGVAERLFELAESEKDETARKACIDLLKEGLQHNDDAAANPDLYELVRKGKLPPWVLLRTTDRAGQNDNKKDSANEKNAARERPK
ncbi:MAG: hypothetical protein SVT52_07610 [Planctomycetota bacterium]|nr:hypothetical protein [Planctomycetota bacterium]